MTEKEKMLDNYLVQISSNLDISDTMREKAEASYRAIGQWLGECDDTSDVKIMPQGSFNLGTVIRPISDVDEYDIDLVCLLKNGKNKSETQIKNLVGDRLKEHKVYSKMLQREGKRCWTLSYSEFHMDILPCVPKDGIYEEPNLTKIKLTHKQANGTYIPKYSNPYKYHKWFEKRMEVQANKIRKAYATRNNVEIDKVPLYKIKTPLQQAIQLLKRHRDIMYNKLAEHRRKNAPISIIITTLASMAYNNETTLFEALINIIARMEKYIKIIDNKYYIRNPVMSEENFAEKWNTNSAKSDEFFNWLQTIKKDLIDNPLKAQNMSVFANKLEICYGKKIVQRTIKDVGEMIRVARGNDSLYIKGLTGGLQILNSSSGKKVEDHTFFGK